MADMVIARNQITTVVHKVVVVEMARIHKATILTEDSEVLGLAKAAFA